MLVILACRPLALRGSRYLYSTVPEACPLAIAAVESEFNSRLHHPGFEFQLVYA
jgi:hypothetical protein